MSEEKINFIPWWQNAKVVTLLGTLIAAAMPLTTFIGGHLQKETELGLNAQKQNHQIRMDYINRALTPNMTEAEKELIFGLFAEMDDQAALQRWAKKRHSTLTSQIVVLRKGIKDKEVQQLALENRIIDTDKKIANLEATIEAQNHSSEPSNKTIQLEQQLRAEREKTESEVAKLQILKESTESLRVRVGEPTREQLTAQPELRALVNKFIGSERKIASSMLIELYRKNPRSVVNALINGILTQSEKGSYRVNLYIAYTLGNIPSGWQGSQEQKEKIKRLMSTRNHDDPTFKRRIKKALTNYAGAFAS